MENGFWPYCFIHNCIIERSKIRKGSNQVRYPTLGWLDLALLQRKLKPWEMWDQKKWVSSGCWLSKSGWGLGGCSAKSMPGKGRRRREVRRRKKRKGKIPQSQCAFVKPLACFVFARSVWNVAAKWMQFRNWCFRKIWYNNKECNHTENVKSDKEEKIVWCAYSDSLSGMQFRQLIYD